MKRKENCDPASVVAILLHDIGLDKYDKDFDGKFYKPWYSSRFKNIEEVSDYWKEQYNDLEEKFTLFKNAFYASTLPPEVIEAVAANLTILKSPTVMRQYDGRFGVLKVVVIHGVVVMVPVHMYGTMHRPFHIYFLHWKEVCVILSFVKAKMKKVIRIFRATLADQTCDHDFHAAADGQLGGIMKVYREWRISGDNEWLKKMYPMVKASMDYCIQHLGSREKGMIEEPHHNTYDIEFWGPDGMHCSFYLGALNAIIAMGKFLEQDVSKYEDIGCKAERNSWKQNCMMENILFRKFNTQD